MAVGKFEGMIEVKIGMKIEVMTVRMTRL